MKLTMKLVTLVVLSAGFAYSQAGVKQNPVAPGGSSGGSCTAAGPNGASCGTGTCPSGQVASCQGSTTGQPTCNCI